MLGARRLKRALRFRRCPGCDYDWATGEGKRACSYYDCPYLPAELRVVCDWCGYNFVLGEGQIRCDHVTCERALALKANVPTYEHWQESLEQDG